MLPNQLMPMFDPGMEINLLKNVCSKSFYRFVQEFWPIIVPEKPVWNWHVEYLCQKLQDLYEDVVAGRPKKYDLIINLPPGSSKSSLFSILFPSYAWIKMPSCRFITASFSYDLAEDFARKSKIVMHSDLYQKCFGKFKFFPERVGHYMNQYKGERIICTTGSSPTGRHAHFILIDDPVDPLQTERETAIFNVNTWMHRVIRTRTVDASVTPLILIMQRLSVDDPTGDWISKMGIEGHRICHISLPASIEDGQEVKPPGLKRYYKDQLFDPVRLPFSVLHERKCWMSSADYSAQYDQNPLPKEGLMFKVQNLIVKEIEPLDPIVARVRYWDKAISTSMDACYTVGCLMGRTKTGKFVVMDIKRGRWDAATREAIILATAKADGPKTSIGIEQEPGPIWEEESVLMADGSECPLKDIRVGDVVINQFGHPTRVARVHDRGKLLCRKIMSCKGDSVYAALTHPFVTPEGNVLASDMKRGTPLWRMEDMELRADAVCDIRDGLSFPCRCLTVEQGESFVVNNLVVHNSSGIESALYTVNNLAGYNVRADKASAAKETRAEPMAIQVEHGNVFMLPGNWNSAYITELGSFPRGRYKDQVDASCGAFKFLCFNGTRIAGALFD